MIRVHCWCEQVAFATMPFLDQHPKISLTDQARKGLLPKGIVVIGFGGEDLARTLCGQDARIIPALKMQGDQTSIALADPVMHHARLAEVTPLLQGIQWNGSWKRSGESHRSLHPFHGLRYAIDSDFTLP